MTKFYSRKAWLAQHLKIDVYVILTDQRKKTKHAYQLMPKKYMTKFNTHS